MAAAKEGPRDLYMQFAGISLNLAAGDSTTFTEGKLSTGLAIRAGLMWLIHRIEFITGMDGCAVANTRLQVALCTRPGLTTYPSLNSNRVLAQYRAGVLSLGAENVFCPGGPPALQHFLPPVPLAAGNLSLYAKTLVDDTGMRNAQIEVRLGYTTAPLTAAGYAEIAEVWGY